MPFSVRFFRLVILSACEESLSIHAVILNYSEESFNMWPWAQSGGREIFARRVPHLKNTVLFLVIRAFFSSRHSEQREESFNTRRHFERPRRSSQLPAHHSPDQKNDFWFRVWGVQKSFF